jgi:23S rRNA (pseudouridine1915-N3)-methyltransferase
VKLHILTIGEPKLPYARAGWDEYLKRLGRYHQVRTTHLSDRHADDAPAVLQAAGKAYIIALVIDAAQLDSPELSHFLDRRAHEGRELCFVIGGPEGLPAAVIADADLRWSLSKLTFPHDLAMLVLAEALYRASTISAGHPYHRA